MRPPCFEYALNKLFHISFSDLLQAVHPLSDPERMGNKSFTLSVTFVFGDEDYMRIIDGNDSIKLLSKLSNKSNKYYILNNSGHVLNKDNTLGLTTILINDTLGVNLPLQIEEKEDQDDYDQENTEANLNGGLY